MVLIACDCESWCWFRGFIYWNIALEFLEEFTKGLAPCTYWSVVINLLLIQPWTDSHCLRPAEISSFICLISLSTKLHCDFVKEKNSHYRYKYKYYSKLMCHLMIRSCETFLNCLWFLLLFLCRFTVLYSNNSRIQQEGKRPYKGTWFSACCR